MTEKFLITSEEISRYSRKLFTEEKSKATAEKYVRYIKSFGGWLGGKSVTKESAIRYKQSLTKLGYAPATVNGCLAALNKLFSYHNKPWKLKYLHVQHKLFRDDSKDLSKAEYEKMLNVLSGNRKKERLCLMIETICSTGIRASELKYITVQAARQRQAVIALKGKIRTVLLPESLCKKLLDFAVKKGICAGVIFKTRNGTPLDRRQIWSEVKGAAAAAKVKTSKAYPHNLRHLFARTFYNSCKDIVKLSDVLGHSSVNTTRIYLVSTGTEHRTALNKMGLVL
ncbi:MAG: site-specific integrase [Clostridia bacterium]|nr:site-specific integrase [Clostridia bacterium]